MFCTECREHLGYPPDNNRHLDGCRKKKAIVEKSTVLDELAAELADELADGFDIESATRTQLIDKAVELGVLKTKTTRLTKSELKDKVEEAL